MSATSSLCHYRFRGHAPRRVLHLAALGNCSVSRMDTGSPAGAFVQAPFLRFAPWRAAHVPSVAKTLQTSSQLSAAAFAPSKLQGDARAIASANAGGRLSAFAAHTSWFRRSARSRAVLALVHRAFACGVAQLGAQADLPPASQLRVSFLNRRSFGLRLYAAGRLPLL